MSRTRHRARERAMECAIKLLDLADKRWSSDPSLSRRYVELAWRLKTKFNLRFSREVKMHFCKRCFTIWRPGETCRVRIRDGVLTVTCLNCNRVYRLPLPAKR